MKTLSQLSRDALIADTRLLVSEEKRLELELLDHLREIERRMLHLEMGYPSLYEFAVRHLGLSEASAYRRIAAMRVVREIPEVKSALVSGRLSLTNVAAVQTLFRAEKKGGKKRSVEEKKELFRQIEGLSKRDCKRKLLEIAPEALPRERERALTSELTELKLVLDAETMAMLAELKNAHPQATAADLVKRAIGAALEQVKKVRTPKFAPVQKGEGASKSVVSQAEMRRQTFARAENRCEFVNESGKRCGSAYGLEVDHRIPRAMGGGAMLENLRVLCRAHNGYEAVRILGRDAMRGYLPAITS